MDLSSYPSVHPFIYSSTIYLSICLLIYQTIDRSVCWPTWDLRILMKSRENKQLKLGALTDANFKILQSISAAVRAIENINPANFLARTQVHSPRGILRFACMSTGTVMVVNVVIAINSMWCSTIIVVSTGLSRWLFECQVGSCAHNSDNKDEYTPNSKKVDLQQ